MSKKFSLYLIVALISLTSCKEAKIEELHLFEGNAMTMAWTVKVAGPLDHPEEVTRIIDSTFREIDDIYNRWNPNSEISYLNRLKANTTVPISDELASILKLAGDFVVLSNGKFDPTIEPLQELWKEKLSKNSAPTKEEIAKTLEYVGWNHFLIEKGSFTKDRDLTSFDLGGIATGFGVDLIATRLRDAGYANVYVNWSNEVRALGEQSHSVPWYAAVPRVEGTSKDMPITQVALKDEGLATSGDYQEFWILRFPDGTQRAYFHVMNTDSGEPLRISSDSISAVTVLAPDCATADALATTAMMFASLEDAKDWIQKVEEKFPSVKFWFVTRTTEE